MKPNQKLVCDFDGVLTELSHEAERVLELFLESTGLVAEREPLCRRVLAEVANAGWEVRGRITAYADEDGFIFVNGLAAWLDRAVAAQVDLGHAVYDAHARLVSIGAADFKMAAQHSYERMAREVMAGASSPMDGVTPSVVEMLRSGGVEIVLVSNSGTSRIEDIFKKAGIPDGSARIRGGAGKFILGEQPQWIEWGGRRIDTNRPQYEAILREERPDAVIGDVFSLDLALPMQLALAEPSLFPRGLKLCLRVRPYTPAWVLGAFEQASQRPELARSGISVHAIRELPDLTRALLA